MAKMKILSSRSCVATRVLSAGSCATLPGASATAARSIASAQAAAREQQAPSVDRREDVKIHLDEMVPHTLVSGNRHGVAGAPRSVT